MLPAAPCKLALQAAGSALGVAPGPGERGHLVVRGDAEPENSQVDQHEDGEVAQQLAEPSGGQVCVEPHGTYPYPVGGRCSPQGAAPGALGFP